MTRRFPPNPTRAPHRPGASLVEMLAVITLSTFLFTAVVATLRQMQRVDQRFRSDLTTSQMFLRLSARWRDDVHAARRAETVTGDPVGESRPPLILHTDDGKRTTYELAGPRVLRTVYHGDEVHHRDSFGVSPPAHVRWERAGGENGYCILVLEQGSRELRVRAALGMDRRDPLVGE